MKRRLLLLGLIILSALVFFLTTRDTVGRDVELVAHYFTLEPGGSLFFNAGPYKEGTAIIGPNDSAFWVKDGKAYTVNEAAKEVAPELQQAPEDIQYDLAFTAAALESDDDEADRALDEAERLAEEGDYAGALEKHIWYHENALAVSPSHYGVRLSFALSDWIDLAAKYPEALAALKDIRDEKTSRLEAGDSDRELFHDVISINQHLGESSATVELFERVEAQDPDFASTLYDAVNEDLVQAKEFGLARKYLGDPIDRLATLRRQFEEGVKRAESSGFDLGREMHEKLFTDRVVRIITVLKETGDSEGAKNIQSEALKTLDNSIIRDAIDP